jgi:phospholipid transport system transporter-binding protein
MAVLALPAQATLAQARALEREADAALAAAGAEGVQVDASALAEFDTSLIALLLHVQRAAIARGVPVRLRGAPAKLHDLARLYGVEELLPLAAAGA